MHYPKVKVINHQYSDHKVSKAKRLLKKYFSIILNSSEQKQIKKINLKLRHNVLPKVDHKVGFLKMWNPKTKTATIWIAPNWMDNLAGGIKGGIIHELWHIKQILKGKLIPQLPKPNDHFRVLWRKSQNKKYQRFHRVYYMNKLDTSFDEDYKEYLRLLKKHQPWEYEAVLAMNRHLLSS